MASLKNREARFYFVNKVFKSTEEKRTLSGLEYSTSTLQLKHTFCPLNLIVFFLLFENQGDKEKRLKKKKKVSVFKVLAHRGSVLYCITLFTKGHCCQVSGLSPETQFVLIFWCILQDKKKKIKEMNSCLYPISGDPKELESLLGNCVF